MSSRAYSLRPLPELRAFGAGGSQIEPHGAHVMRRALPESPPRLPPLREYGGGGVYSHPRRIGGPRSPDPSFDVAPPAVVPEHTAPELGTLGYGFVAVDLDVTDVDIDVEDKFGLQSFTLRRGPGAGLDIGPQVREGRTRPNELAVVVVDMSQSVLDEVAGPPLNETAVAVRLGRSVRKVVVVRGPDGTERIAIRTMTRVTACYLSPAATEQDASDALEVVRRVLVGSRSR